MTKFKIGKNEISDNGALYFIADIAANHDGDLNRAFKLIELAKSSGAHAAKFQNFSASKIVSKKGFDDFTNQLSHQAGWKKSVYETYEDASIPFEWTVKLKEKCNEVGIEYFTSPYDFESVDFVDPYVSAFKIGSGDVTWHEIIEYIAKKGKPVILATGASSMSEVKSAMNILLFNNNDIVIMQCNTNYTGKSENFKYINLNVLKTYSKMFPNTVLGLSDHTHGHSTVLGAFSLGARVFEKHFTDDNYRDGPDHKFAMNPKSWGEMVKCADELYQSLGDGEKIIEKNELETALVQRRCLRFVKNFQKTILLKDDLIPLRPRDRNGIPPYELNNVIGELIRNVSLDEHISYKDLY